MAYESSKDVIKVKIDHPDTNLVVYVASYDGNPRKIRIHREGKGRSFAESSVKPEELLCLIDLLNTVSGWLDEYPET